MKSRLKDDDVPKLITDLNKECAKLSQLITLGTKEQVYALWNKSSDLRTVFCGGLLMVNEKFGLSIQIGTLSSWRNDLNRIMSASLVVIAETMLKTNKEYASWFYGKDCINLDTVNSKELIHHFELALLSSSEKIVNWLWQDNKNLWRAISELASKKQTKLIDKVKAAGFELIISDENQLSLTYLTKKRKAEDALESEPYKLSKLSSESSTPEKVKRYFLRSAGSASQHTHFKSQSAPPASFNLQTNIDDNEKGAQPSLGI